MAAAKKIILALGFLAGLCFLVFAPGVKAQNSDTISGFDKSRVGVFGLPSDKAGELLGATWTRIPITWEEWERYRKTGRKSTKLKNLDNLTSKTKIVLTLTSKNRRKTKCLHEKAQGASWSTCPPDKKYQNDYLKFVDEISKAYKNKVAVWQIGNEPYRSPYAYKFFDGPFDDSREMDFIDVFELTRSKIKENIPNAKIAAAGINFGKMEFSNSGQTIANADSTEQMKWDRSAQNYRDFLQKECSKLDYVDLHLYHTVESIPGRVRWSKNQMQSLNCDKPILATEIGGPNPKPGTEEYQKMLTDDGYFNDLQKQDFKNRYSAILNNTDIQAAIWFYYQDIGSGGSAGNDLLSSQFGLVDEQGAAKPAYALFARSNGLTPPANPPTYSDPLGLGGAGGAGGAGGTGGSTSGGSAGGTTGGGSAGGTTGGVGSGAGGAGSTSGGSALTDFVPADNPASNFPSSFSGITTLIFRIAIIASSVIFILLMLFGGVAYLFGGGNEESLTRARKLMLNGVIGLAFTVGAYGIGVWILRAIGYHV